MKIKRIFKYSLITLLGFIVLLVLFTAYLYFTADMKQPQRSPDEIISHELVKDDSLRTYGPNYLHLASCGLWEQYLQGDAFERGFASGKLAEDLLYFQEKVFVD